jgi:hypothetical protein
VILAGAILLLSALAAAQEPAAPSAEVEAEKAVDFVCPMDPDVRAKGPGKCPKCGMRLEAGLPDFIEYPLKLTTQPRAVRAGRPVRLSFQVTHPKTGRPVKQFEVMHEKLFHLFLVSHDLDFFAHEHPELGKDAIFRFSTTLPKPGLYRVLGDFYPAGGTPQLVPKTLITAAFQGAPIPKLAADLAPKSGENLRVELTTEPPQPLAGKKTLLFFKIDPAQGLEPYLGAWGHLLAASDDLIDMIHMHPAFPEPGPHIQFNVLFPREAVYRIWVQFQREGKVNTVSFTVPVKALR